MLPYKSKAFLGVYSLEQYLWGDEWRLSEQREKFNCNAVATKASTNPTRSSGTRRDLQTYPEGRQRDDALAALPQALLGGGCSWEGIVYNPEWGSFLWLRTRPGEGLSSELLAATPTQLRE